MRLVLMLQRTHQVLKVNCLNPFRMAMAVWKLTRTNLLMVKQTFNISQECQDLEAIILDQSGPDKMDSAHSGKDVPENHLSE
jgi:hypothetical protein